MIDGRVFSEGYILRESVQRRSFFRTPHWGAFQTVKDIFSNIFCKVTGEFCMEVHILDSRLSKFGVFVNN